MRDDLTDDQRARLCIIEAVIDTVTEPDSFDVLRIASWVETGQHPESVQVPTKQRFPAVLQ